MTKDIVQTGATWHHNNSTHYNKTKNIMKNLFYMDDACLIANNTL